MYKQLTDRIDHHTSITDKKNSIKALQSHRNSSFETKPFIIYVPCQDITITNHVLPHIHGSTTSHNRSILLYNANKSSESQTDYY